MSVKNFSLSGIGHDVQLGKGGGRLHYDSGSAFFKFVSTADDLLTLRAAAPVTNDDVATKQYVDNVAAGIKPLAAVHTATTGPITLSGLQTIDDYVLQDGDRVLVKNQASAIDNGIYVAHSGAWTRSTDMNDSPTYETQAGSFVFVDNGTINGNSGFVLLGEGILHAGTDALNWTHFSGAGQITASEGVRKDGNVVSLDFTDTNTVTTELGTDKVLVQQAGTVKQTTLSQILGLAYKVQKDDSKLEVVDDGIAAGTVQVTTDGQLVSTFGYDSAHTELLLGDVTAAHRISGGAGATTALHVTGTTGSAVVVSGGDAAASSNNNGADVVIRGGVGDGTGTNGAVVLHSGDASSTYAAVGEDNISLVSMGGHIGTNTNTQFHAVMTSFTVSTTNSGSEILFKPEGVQTVTIDAAGLTMDAGKIFVGNVTVENGQISGGAEAGSFAIKGVAATTTDTDGSDVIVSGGLGNGTGLDGEVQLVSGANSLVVSEGGITTAGTYVEFDGSIRVTDNTISTQQTDQNLVFAPNGTGKLTITGASYEARIVADNDITTKKYVDDAVSGAVGSLSSNSISQLNSSVVVTDSGTNGTITLAADGTTIATVTSTGIVVNNGTLTLAGAPTADLHAATKKYVDDGLALKANLSGSVATLKATVDLTSGTTQAIGTLPAGADVLEVRVMVVTPSDTATTVDIGKAGNVEAYAADTMIDTQTAGLYKVDTYVNEASSVTVNATVGSAGTVGSAIVIVTYRNA